MENVLIVAQLWNAQGLANMLNVIINGQLQPALTHQFNACLDKAALIIIAPKNVNQI